MNISYLKSGINIILFILLQSCFTSLQAQSKEETIYDYADEMPVFKGDYMAYLMKNLRYPQAALDSNIQGSVYIEIIIGKTGKVEDVQIRKNLPGGLGEEAARVIREMPDWTPARLNGNPVRSKVIIPVKFVLAADTRIEKSKNEGE